HASNGSVLGLPAPWCCLSWILDLHYSVKPADTETCMSSYHNYIVGKLNFQSVLFTIIQLFITAEFCSCFFTQFERTRSPCLLFVPLQSYFPIFLSFSSPLAVI
uniref:Uncharacterized protein n=1 Tax=Pelusios castaneus TaxID=367368 RepID=A0A8C8VLW9_9SAUR